MGVFAMKWTCKHEFRGSSFGLDHHDAHTFHVCTWQNKREVTGWFITYRVAVLLVSFGIFIASLTNAFVAGWKNYWIIYMTHWGVIGLVLQNALALAATIERVLHHRNDPNAEAEMTILTKMSWVMYNVMTLAAIIITIVYWSALYSPDAPPSAIDVFVHALNSVIIVVDIVVTHRPFRLLHFLHPLLIMVDYIIFTVIYWAAGGVDYNGNHYIYPVLNWDKPEDSAIFVVVGAVAGLVLYVVLWGVHLLRDRFLAAVHGHTSVHSTGHDNLAVDIKGI